MSSNIATKGQIIPAYSSETEDYICKLILSEDGLVIERAEYLKENICLYDIPLKHIIEFDFINKRKQRTSIEKSFWMNILGIFALLFSGTGFTHRAHHATDILSISFYNNNGEVVKLVFDMMEFGEHGLVRYYQKLTG